MTGSCGPGKSHPRKPLLILPRNPYPNRPAKPPVVDHFAVSIASWDKVHVESELKRRRLEYREDPQLPNDSFHVLDPDGYDLQLVNEKVKG
jgi:hypothetical protein